MLVGNLKKKSCSETIFLHSDTFSEERVFLANVVLDFVFMWRTAGMVLVVKALAEQRNLLGSSKIAGDLFA